MAKLSTISDVNNRYGITGLNEALLPFRDFNLYDNSILLAYCGSISHGTYRPNSNPNSIDDKDVIGIVVPPSKYFLSLKKFEHYRGEFVEWDLVVYEIRKYVRLLLKSNPNVISLLWTPEKYFLRKTSVGELLIKNRDVFSSKQIYKSFIGYAYSQLKKMEYSAFKGYMGEKRKMLVEKYGYDVKNASHLIRLLKMGKEFLITGELEVERRDAGMLVDIKMGKWSLDDVRSTSDQLFRGLDVALENSPLPERPNFKKAEELVEQIVLEHLNLQQL